MGGVYTRIRNVQSLRPGDHICIWDYSRWPISYQHHGIVWCAGSNAQEIRVCHVWSPLETAREAQLDSCFRISTLEEFMYKRNPSHLRLVEYHTSGLRELLSRWGEVHLSPSDLPEVVLTRCKFLLGLGKGEFHIFRQNCEHAAYWCMTGKQWCKQNLTHGKGRIPFENSISKDEVEALEKHIDEIRKISNNVIQNVVKLSQQLVYLRVRGSYYVKILESGQLGIVHEHENDAQDCGRTAFRLTCYVKGHNSVKTSLFHEASGRCMFSRSTLSCFRDLRMKKANLCRGTTGAKWEYSSLGFLVSMNQHRRYIGIGKHNILTDVSMRGDACRIEFIPCSDSESMETPDIHSVTRQYKYQSAIEGSGCNPKTRENEQAHGLDELPGL
ncbi:hypothetical protein ABG067_004452 [Albugo candida]